MSFKQLNQIDERTKLAVHGWIRNKEKILNLANVPGMINAMCILYFRDDEIFDIVGLNHIQLSKDRKMITKISNEPIQRFAVGQGSWDTNNYGIMEVASNTDMIYEWKLKIINDDSSSGDVQIGIASELVQDSFIEKGVYYLFYSDRKRCSPAQFWVSYDSSFTKGDEVIIHLDLKKAEIYLIVNGIKGPIAYKNVVKSEDVKYRLAVSLYDLDVSVEIIGFTKRL